MLKSNYSCLCIILILMGALSFSAESSDLAAENEYFNTSICQIIFAIQSSSEAGKFNGEVIGDMVRASGELKRNKLAKSISVSKRLELDSLSESHVAKAVLAETEDVSDATATAYKQLFYEASCTKVIRSAVTYTWKTYPSGFDASPDDLGKERFDTVVESVVAAALADMAFNPIKSIESELSKSK